MLQDLTTGEITNVAGDEASGLPLGVFSEAEFTAQTTEIPVNSRLLFDTDGLAEAFPGQTVETHVEFGMRGIFQTLRETAQEPLSAALLKLFDDSTPSPKAKVATTTRRCCCWSSVRRLSGRVRRMSPDSPSPVSRHRPRFTTSQPDCVTLTE